MAALLLRVFSGKRLSTPGEVKLLEEEFYRRKNEIYSALLQNAEVRALVEMIYDTSNTEAQYFLKFPSISWLKENPELVLEIVSVLSSRGAPFVGKLGEAVEKYGVEALSEIVLELFNLLSSVTQQIAFGGNLTDVLEYGWELGSPLSSRPRHSPHQPPSKSRSFPISHHFRRDGANRLAPCMDKPLPVSTSGIDERDGVNGREQYGRYPVKQVEDKKGYDCEPYISSVVVGKDSADKPGPDINRMRVAGPSVAGADQAESETVPRESSKFGGDGSLRVASAISSRGHSSRRSYAGSELYTTDSDDDSLSTSSHVSLLVGVSEAHEISSSSSSSSSSGDDSASENEARIAPSTGGCRNVQEEGSHQLLASSYPDRCFVSEIGKAVSGPAHDVSAVESEVTSGPEDNLEDKLPICSSVVLSSKGSGVEDELSFYAPEMWTYSEKEGNDTDSTQVPNGLEHYSGEHANENEEEPMEEVKVVIAPSVKGKYVSVCVQPVTVKSWDGEATKLAIQDSSFLDKTDSVGGSGDTTKVADTENESGVGTEVFDSGLRSENVKWMVKSGEENTAVDKVSENEAAKLPNQDSSFVDQTGSDRLEENTYDTTEAPDSELHLENVKGVESGGEDIAVAKVSEIEASNQDKAFVDKTDSKNVKRVASGEQDIAVDKFSKGEAPKLPNQDQSFVDSSADSNSDGQVDTMELAEKECTEGGNDLTTEASDSERNAKGVPESGEHGTAVDKVSGRDITENADSQDSDTEGGEQDIAVNKVPDNEATTVPNQTNSVVNSGLDSDRGVDTTDLSEKDYTEGEQDTTADKVSEHYQSVDAGGANSQDSNNNSDLDNEKQVTKDLHDTSRVAGNEDLETPPDVAVAEQPPGMSEAQDSERQDSSQNIKEVDAPPSAQHLDKSLDDASDLETSGSLKSESPRSTKSPPKPEASAISYSGLLPLSGPLTYSSHTGTVPYSGSLSLRSDSSTNSTRSFAFPILSSEWNSSPVKMAPPDRNYMRNRKRPWRSLCCFCSRH